MLAALAATGFCLALPSAASAQGLFDPNSGRYYQYFTPYSDASGTTYYYPGRTTTSNYRSPSDSMTFVPQAQAPLIYGPGDFASTIPYYHGYNAAPYVTNYNSWYSPYRRLRYGRR
jgi:hypothetical protein